MEKSSDLTSVKGHKCSVKFQELMAQIRTAFKSVLLITFTGYKCLKSVAFSGVLLQLSVVYCRYSNTVGEKIYV